MLKKTISYTDYNGVERREDFYFNLSKAELAEMELTTPGGMGAMLNRLIESRDDTEIVRIFKKLVLQSYGEKSIDGKRFIKSKELSEAFSQTEAYSKLFMELASDSKAASEFVKGIVPADIQNEMSKVNTNELPSGLN